MKIHIRVGKTLTCPYRHCDKSFIVLSTFTSHMNRKRKNGVEKNLFICDMASPMRLEEQPDIQIDPKSDAGDEQRSTQKILINPCS